MRKMPKVFLPLLSAAGVAFAIYAVVVMQRHDPPLPPEIPPPRTPFKATIAGSGVVEAAAEHTTSIGPPVAGLILELYVTVGQVVSAGTPLLRLDDRQLRAQRLYQVAQRDVARAQLDQLLAQPRPENVPPLEAQVAQAEAVAANWSAQVSRFTQAYETGRGTAVSLDQLDQARWNYTASLKSLEVARSNLALMKAGAWQPDIASARAVLAQAEAAIRQTDALIAIYTVRAPTDGTVLQVNVREGEYATTTIAAPYDLSQSTGMIVFGDISSLRVRVDVDEESAPGVRADVKAFAMLRGYPAKPIPLEYLHVDPFVGIKKSLTGANVERVDTRTLQVEFKVGPHDVPLYVGQMVDVFIEATGGEGPIASQVPAPTR